MKLILTLISIALIATQAVATAPPESCTLRMSENGSFIMLQGVVDPQSWPRGEYEMTIEARQGGNRSLSRQAGAFDVAAMTADGMLVLSTTTTYVSDGGRLAVTLHINDGTRNTVCSLDFER